MCDERTQLVFKMTVKRGKHTHLKIKPTSPLVVPENQEGDVLLLEAGNGAVPRTASSRRYSTKPSQQRRKQSRQTDSQTDIQADSCCLEFSHRNIQF